MRLRRKSFRNCAILAGGFLLLVGAIGFYLNANNRTSALAEVNPDIWEIDYKIYDDTNGSGMVATDNVDWVIPASQQNDLLRREYLFQINYHAPVVDRDYAPGELELKMPLAFKRRTDYTIYSDLFYDGYMIDDIGREYTDFQGIVTTEDILFGARPVGNNFGDYDWEYECVDYKQLPRGQKPYCIFRNLKPIEKDSSVEGAIQITYKISTKGAISAPMFKEQFSQIYTNPDMKVVLNDAVESNPVSLRIEHEREVEWRKEEYNVNIKARQLNSVDGLGEGAEDYIWVRYVFFGYGENKAAYELPYDNPSERYLNASQHQLIPVKDFAFYDSFSEGVLVLDNNKQQMLPDENGEYRVSDSPIKKVSDSCRPLTGNYSSSSTCYDVYVGYPRSIYGDEDGKISQISTTVYSRGTYFLEDELSELDDDTATFNIGDFDFNYQGNQVGVSKQVLSTKFGFGNVRPNISHQANQTEEGSTVFFDLSASALNIGKTPYDLVVADDLLYIEDMDTGEISRLSEDDYSFKTVHVYTSVTLTNDENFDCRSYNKGNIFYRLRGETEYQLLDFGANGGTSLPACSTGGTGLNLSLPDNVVDVKYVLKDMWTGVRNFRVGVELNISSKTLPRNGKIHNFDYVDLVYDGAQQNIPSIDDYSTQTTKDLVASYDLEHYGIYKQRGYNFVEYVPKTLEKVLTDNQSGIQYLDEAIYDPTTESFLGYMTTGGYVTQVSSDGETNLSALKSLITDDEYIRSVEWYVLVPKGMEVISTESEIGTSFDRCRIYDNNSPFPNHEIIFGMTDEPVFESEQDCINYINSHSDVAIMKNWRDTGFTLIRIHLDFSEKPFSNMNARHDFLNPSVWFEGARIAYKIPYEVYAENDANTTQDNRYRYIVSTFAPNDGSYKEWDHHLNAGTNYRGYSKDDGHYTRYYDWKYLYEPAFADIDNDGDTEEEMEMRQDDMTLALSMAVQQELKKTVSTDLTNAFSTDESEVSLGGEYQHKLSIRTGNNNATDIVLYDNIETAFGDNVHWQGTFRGVDTSFAESLTDSRGKAIAVEVYYSANDDAGALEEDDSWTPYVEGETDKSEVRSLAFKIMTVDGNVATLPAQKYLHVLINMTAPGEEDDAEGLAYNSSHSEWKLLNPVSGEPIPDVGGIYSNTVTVKLNVPEPEPDPDEPGEPEPDLEEPENPHTFVKVGTYGMMFIISGATFVCLKRNRR